MARRMRAVPDEEKTSKQGVALEEMTDEALLCRADRHKWERAGDTDITLRRNYLIEFTRNWNCEHCGASVWKTYAVPSFAVVKKGMSYPPGYLSSEGRIHGADVKREELSRMGFKIKREAAESA